MNWNPVAQPLSASSADWRLRLLRLAPHDLLALCYPAAFALALLWGSPRGFRDPELPVPILSIALVALCLSWVCRESSRSLWKTWFHHLLPIAAILPTYLRLRHIIPVANPSEADAMLARLDLQLLGSHPSILLEPRTGPSVIEALSFIYQSYFYVLAVIVLAEVFTDRNLVRQAHFGLGFLLLMLLGHVQYVLVPARGPLFHLAPSYAAPLPDGEWYRVVMETQRAAGPIWDAFPSLHVATSIFLAYWAAKRWSFLKIPAWTWAGLVVISTVVLRFHYVVDVVAGCVLVGVSIWAAPRLSGAWQQARDRHGCPVNSPW